jgi:[FeFe] hydrogenase H-cluster maturation GTPase HydF
MSQSKVIGIFGDRNVGKSSLINALTGQQVAIVSEVAGTTTDPVRKRIELPGVGVCTLIDTAGLDDDGGALGAERVAKSLAAARQVDLGILVFAGNRFPDGARQVARLLQQLGVPFLLVHNKQDLEPLKAELRRSLNDEFKREPLETSSLAAKTEDRDRLTAAIREAFAGAEVIERPMFEGLLEKGKLIVLVCPIDSEAPQSRLILPQVNAIRAILDGGGIATVLQPEELADYLAQAGKGVGLVVTDSQVFARVAAIVPEAIPLTSFSMLLARSMGSFDTYRAGVTALDRLQDGDRILMLESCTHHANCEDIGRVKLPALIRRHSGKQLEFDMVTGLDPLGDLSRYALAIQCGGCMVTARQLQNRVRTVAEAGLPVVNYGMAISYLTGIYQRALQPLL